MARGEMMGWQDTAKRLAAHPKWEWRKLDRRLGVFDVDDEWEMLDECHRNPAYPDLTDWPTVGCLLGMVVEAGGYAEFTYLDKKVSTAAGIVSVEQPEPGRVEVRVPRHTYPTPGQALGELLLELWGES
jgi:hypothetical protein